MLLRKMLRAANFLLILAIVCVLAGAWWIIGRTAPKTSGTLLAPVAAEVLVTRDSLGIPHISARSIEDALFAQGYATAQDRLWQMDMLRRVAAGELSEVAGKVALELDTTARKLRMRHIAERQLARLAPPERALLAAYVRGVNEYISKNDGRWGPEFVAMGYEPRPWSPIDTLLVGLHMDRTLTSSWETDLRKARMIADGDPAKVRRLFPQRTGGEIIPGSNAWAIRGTQTASGKPLLASDPHLEFSVPAPWYVVHLKAPGLNVIGGSLPGTPLVLIGHNENIAWGITSLQMDSQDLYIERIDMRTGGMPMGERSAKHNGRPRSSPLRVNVLPSC